MRVSDLTGSVGYCDGALAPRHVFGSSILPLSVATPHYPAAEVAAAAAAENRRAPAVVVAAAEVVVEPAAPVPSEAPAEEEEEEEVVVAEEAAAAAEVVETVRLPGRLQHRTQVLLRHRNWKHHRPASAG